MSQTVWMAKASRVQAHQVGGEILFPVSEAVLKVVTLVLQNVERLILDLPPGPATGGKFDDGIGTDRQIGDEAVAIGGLATRGLMISISNQLTISASRPSRPRDILEPAR